jgi:hypothetical protein
MQLSTNRNRKDGVPSAAPGWHFHKSIGARVLAAAIVFVTLAASHSLNSQQSPNPGKPILLPEANRPPDANAQMAMREQQNKKQSFEAANIERKKQINDDSARLLKLASDLKAEVDKTSKDTLSIGVIRKADEIEKLAHTVKEKMKLTMSAN